MKLAFVGVGDAGTRIVDRLVRAERASGRSVSDGNVLVFNTDDAAFEAATAVPDERRVLLGDTHPAVRRRPDPAEAGGADGAETADGAGGADETEALASEIDPFGVGGDPDTGAAVAEAELPEIRRALDRIDETEVAGTMLVTGLGGGTGTGVGSVLLEELNSIYETPVYVLGALPAATEPDRRALTAARGIRTVVPLADAVFPVDNEAWRRGDPVAERYDAINDAIAARVLALFGAGERDPESVSELRVDPADVTRTLEVGGVASIGHATHELTPDDAGVVTRLLRLLGIADAPESDGAEADAATVKRLVRRALESTLTLPCSVDSADRVLVILSGPPDAVSRKGFETGRYLLEEETETVEVLAGDEPVPGATEVTATVVLSNVTDVPRIDEIQRRAVAALDASDAGDDGKTVLGDAADADTRSGAPDPADGPGDDAAGDSHASEDGQTGNPTDGAAGAEPDGASSESATETDGSASEDGDGSVHGFDFTAGDDRGK
jgi:cell division GTPase FtsZ